MEALRGQQQMPLSLLLCMVEDGKYAAELGSLRVGELYDAPEALRIEPGETIEAALMRLFRRFEGQWLSSQFFARCLGLTRWTAQDTCRQLAEQGRIRRRGHTSDTRYCFVDARKPS